MRQEEDARGWREWSGRLCHLSATRLVPVCGGGGLYWRLHSSHIKNEKEFQVKFFYQGTSFKQKLPIGLLCFCAAMGGGAQTL